MLNKSLVNDLKVFNLNYIILDDGADFINFISQDKLTKKKTCIYIGSFFKGKGLEIIKKLSKLLPDFQFHLYGDKESLPKKINCKLNHNIKFYDYVEYSKIPKILKNYKVALMPFQAKINARSKNLEISKYISPLKMFDYLAAGKIIIASKLKAYDHILKNNKNSLLISHNDLNLWKNLIKDVFKNPHKYSKIKYNAKKTAIKYSWDNRAKKFINFLDKVY